jgi:hypothetical protein
MRVINVGTEGNKKFTLNSMSAPKDYNLSRSQFAKELGITRENLKQRMRRGQYKDHYILENGRYKFTLDEAVRVNKDTPKAFLGGTPWLNFWTFGFLWDPQGNKPGKSSFCRLH